MCTYESEEHMAWFQAAWAKTGKKLDIGKSCIQFKKAEDLALDVIAESIRKTPAKKYIGETEKMLATRSFSPKPAAKKTQAAPSSKKSK